MPHWNSSRRLVVRLVLFTLAGWLLWALGKSTPARAAEAEAVSTSALDETTRPRAKATGFKKRRLAATLAFTTLFFAGAAFSAGAGDLVVGALEGSTETAATSTEAAPEESGEAAVSEEAPGDEGTSSNEASEPAPDPAPNGDEPSAEEGDEGSAAEEGDDGVGNEAGGDEAGGNDAEPADDSDNGETSDPGSDESGSGHAGGSGDSADDSDSGGGNDGTWEDEPADDEPDAGPGSPAHAGDPADADNGGDDVGLTSAEDAAADLEFDGTGYGVVWLHRTLPDPTPAAARLAPGFARMLTRESRANHVDWALVLGVLRATGHRASWPASERSVDQLASRLSRLKATTDEWRAALALGGRTAFADRAIALTRYNRAVGLRALVNGLLAEQPALEQRVLADPRLDIYPGGRDDLANHRINVRVLALVLYLAEAHGQVTVSSLDSGHGLYARPGVVSAHKYGLAVDIAGLEGQSVLGNQQAGGLTERAVRNILLLPAEVKPRQVISLLGLGGPSFPLADHYDHIHVGY